MFEQADFNDYSWYAPTMVFIPLSYIGFLVVALPILRRYSQKVRVLNTNNQRKFLMNILEIIVSTVGLVTILVQGIPILINNEFSMGPFRLVRALCCVPMTIVMVFKMVYRLETHWTMSVHHVVIIVMIYFGLYSIDSTTDATALLGVASWLFIFLLGHVVTDQLALVALMIHRLQFVYTNMWLKATSIQMVMFKFAFTAWLTYAWVRMCWLDAPFVTPLLAWKILYIPVMVVFHGVQLYGWGLVFSSKRRKQQVRRLSIARASVAYDGPFALKLKELSQRNRQQSLTQNVAAANEASVTGTPPDSRRNSALPEEHKNYLPMVPAAAAAKSGAVVINIPKDNKEKVITPRSEMKQPDRVIDVFENPVPELKVSKSQSGDLSENRRLLSGGVSTSSLAGVSKKGAAEFKKEDHKVPEESEVSEESERPGELEVRVIHDSEAEKPIGLIEVTNMEETLLTFRLKILEELDNVPAQFIFMMNGQAVPVTKEPRLKLSMITSEDVIRIRIPSKSGNSAASTLTRAGSAASQEALQKQEKNEKKMPISAALPLPGAKSHFDADDRPIKPSKSGANPFDELKEEPSGPIRPMPRIVTHTENDERPPSSSNLGTPGARSRTESYEDLPGRGREAAKSDASNFSSGSNNARSPRGAGEAREVADEKEAGSDDAALSPRSRPKVMAIGPKKSGLPGGSGKPIGYGTALALVASKNVDDDDVDDGAASRPQSSALDGDDRVVLGHKSILSSDTPRAANAKARGAAPKLAAAAASAYGEDENDAEMDYPQTRAPANSVSVQPNPMAARVSSDPFASQSPFTPASGSKKVGKPVAARAVSSGAYNSDDAPIRGGGAKLGGASAKQNNASKFVKKFDDAPAEEEYSDVVVKGKPKPAALAVKQNKSGVSAKVFEVNKGLGNAAAPVAKPVKAMAHIGDDDSPPPLPDGEYY